jgi:predicted alpha/beta-fold hydrolase
MPIIRNSTYKPPFYAFNKHLETIIPSVLRKVKGVSFRRERIDTADGDFLDLDWLQRGNKRLIIISHGLEGSSHRPYVKGVAKLFHKNGWDALAWNCRSCSQEMNKTAKLYHHGFTVDVKAVVDHAVHNGYEQIGLVGFSMGGSLTMKYIGEHKDHLPSQVKAGMAVSVPCELSKSLERLSEPGNKFYQDRFMKKLTIKLQQKSEQFPGLIEMKPWKSFKNFHEFDTHYSAKIYHFKDSTDFYDQVQCLPHLANIKVPCFILNAENDPMLSGKCYPVELAESNELLSLELTKYGGHVGFLKAGSEYTYAEERALQFFNSQID